MAKSEMSFEEFMRIYWEDCALYGPGTDSDIADSLSAAYNMGKRDGAKSE